MEKPVAYNYVKAERKIAEQAEKIKKMQGEIIQLNLTIQHLQKMMEEQREGKL